MDRDGGAWTLVAKVKLADMDDLPEQGWFDMEIAPAELTSTDLVLSAGLVAAGAQRFSDGAVAEAASGVASCDGVEI